MGSALSAVPNTTKTGCDFMASNAKVLKKLEASIAKRRKLIEDETKSLEAEVAEYNKLYIMSLSDKYKLYGKELFDAIEREHQQLEKLREGGMSDEDIDELTAPVQDSSDHAPGNTVHRYTEVKEEDAPVQGQLSFNLTEHDTIEE